ncbi:MAG: VOC family protein [Verrucomicrobia bacterium]|nr:VOC family protein [Cytophagales bacterium]
MKKEFLGLRTSIYKVSNLEKAKEWYSEVLGLLPYFDEPFYVGFEIEGFELGLQPEKAEDMPKADSVVTYWGVEDINFAYQRILYMGATAHEPPSEVGNEIRVASVKDPWGNVFGLIFNPHFKPAPVQNL